MSRGRWVFSAFRLHRFSPPVLGDYRAVDICKEISARGIGADGGYHRSIGHVHDERVAVNKYQRGSGTLPRGLVDRARKACLPDSIQRDVALIDSLAGMGRELQSLLLSQDLLETLARRRAWHG